MAPIPIYTIGYGNRSVEEFVELLRRYEIQFLLDVRSQPYSRHAPHFSKDALERYLRQREIRYVFMGDALGGRPKDETCYVNGKVDYRTVAARSFYQEGIERLRLAWRRQLRVAIMCAEIKPQECHRSKLISNTLVEQKIAVAHIDEAGELKSQQEINQILMGSPLADQLSLFNEPPTALSKKIGRSRKKYALQGEKA